MDIQTTRRTYRAAMLALCAFCCIGMASSAMSDTRHAISEDHPRLLGPRSRLQQLAKERPDAYRRVAAVARGGEANDHAKMISLGLVCAIEGDEKLGREAVDLAMKYVNGPIRHGHVTFGSDLARCAIVYDLCHEYWTEEERQAFHEYVNKTYDANTDSETHVFHNGWYGYKWWGIGLAAYATYYENERAPEMLKELDREYRTRAAPALELAGAGGGWAEGYYIHYFLYSWVFFCEVARHCEGIDYYALAPNFFQHRAIASMFETYPGISDYGSRRPIPMGDGGGRRFGGDRDQQLSARRILVNHYRDDPAHQAVHSFNETTPNSGVGQYAYKDFLWRDVTVPKGSLADFKLSHLSPGAGYVYARSSWEEDATFFFFKCGDRFTAHQHLDVGHFLIYKHEELAGDGGHYHSFGADHDINYHLRTIAHSTMLIDDPEERWSNIRAGETTGYDGGQMHSWPHHNGATEDPADWHKDRDLYDIADMLAFEDRGDYLYVAGDCTRAYSPKKLALFTRQIVYLRPGTFVIFDRVTSTRPEYKKTWLLQAMKPPTGDAPDLVVTNGKGRLHVQMLLPESPVVEMAMGDGLYRYGGRSYPPDRDTGPAPECRLSVSPPAPAETDYFLHVLTVTDATVDSVPSAVAHVEDDCITVEVGDVRISFLTAEVGGHIQIGGRVTPLTREVASVP